MIVGEGKQKQSLPPMLRKGWWPVIFYGQGWVGAWSWMESVTNVSLHSASLTPEPACSASL